MKYSSLHGAFIECVFLFWFPLVFVGSPLSFGCERSLPTAGKRNAVDVFGHQFDYPLMRCALISRF